MDRKEARTRVMPRGMLGRSLEGWDLLECMGDEPWNVITGIRKLGNHWEEAEDACCGCGIFAEDLHAGEGMLDSEAGCVGASMIGLTNLQDAQMGAEMFANGKLGCGSWDAGTGKLHGRLARGEDGRGWNRHGRLDVGLQMLRFG